MRKQRQSLLSTLLSRLRKSEPQKPSAAKPHAPFQAIAIYRGLDACDMAKKFSEHRFLAREAPTLPLPGCTLAQNCQCRYLKFRDRRAEARRTNDFSAATRLYDQGERRGFRGRRRTD